MSHYTEMGLLWSTGMVLNDHCMAGPEYPLQSCHQMATTGLVPNGHLGLALNGHCNAEAPMTFCRWTDGCCNSFFLVKIKGHVKSFVCHFYPPPFLFYCMKMISVLQKGFLLDGCILRICCLGCILPFNYTHIILPDLDGMKIVIAN